MTLGPPTWATGSWAVDAWADGTWDNTPQVFQASWAVNSNRTIGMDISPE